MSHADPCEVHADHNPQPWDVEVHHVWPTGMGGPNVPANRVALCPTGHTNVHALLRLAFKAGGVHLVPWPTRRRFHVEERALARLGYHAALDHPGYRALLGGS
jgi:hypothetical protein